MNYPTVLIKTRIAKEGGETLTQRRGSREPLPPLFYSVFARISKGPCEIHGHPDPKDESTTTNEIIHNNSNNINNNNNTCY